MNAILPTAANSFASQSTTKEAAVSSDYETFLKMLTVQMRNQDPLNPVEASDFAAQLANFSSVEQQVLTNDLLTSIESRLANSDFAALADWVGMDARSVNAAFFAGDPITTSISPDPMAERRELIVKDGAGREVYRAALGLSDTNVTWTGETSGGTLAANGHYSLFVEGYATGESLGLTQLETYGRIQEARVAPDGLTLVLAGGQAILADQVTALRAPG